MKIKIAPKKVLNYLLASIVLLTILNLVSIILKLNYDNRYIIFLSEIFNFDVERSIPTLFSTLLLMTSSLLLFFIYKSSKGEIKKIRAIWFFLCLIFFYLSLDEFLSLHEKLIPITQDYFEFSTYLHFSWVVPYGTLLLILGLALIPFLKSLPRNILLLFLFSGSIFVLGAIGMEILGSNAYVINGKKSLKFSLMYTIEEFLEKTGIAIYIYSLLLYILENKTKKLFKVTLNSI